MCVPNPCAISRCAALEFLIHYVLCRIGTLFAIVFSSAATQRPTHRGNYHMLFAIISGSLVALFTLVSTDTGAARGLRNWWRN